jgi:hypothetical protein
MLQLQQHDQRQQPKAELLRPVGSHCLVSHTPAALLSHNSR